VHKGKFYFGPSKAVGVGGCYSVVAKIVWGFILYYSVVQFSQSKVYEGIEGWEVRKCE
jgi:hypothetical protein